jgi:hypothetical protein
MALGEIPGGNLRAYYKLENLNDSSGRGFNLTNNNSVAFSPAKYANGADFGTSGTNKGLTTTTNVLSANRPSNYAVRFRFRLNDDADTGNKVLFNLLTGNTFSGGFTYMGARYRISGSNLTISCFCDREAEFNEITLPKNSRWYHVDCLRFGDSSKFLVQIQNEADRILHLNDVTIGASFSQSTTNRLSIGNNQILSNQGYVTIDQFYVDESIYATSGTERNRVKARTHELFGNLVI